MYLRLAFAVAAHLETEILLVDEVLAVGDAQFQQKCLGRMQSVAQAGRTVLFISHDMGAIRRLCRWGFVLNEGKVEFSGQIKDAVEFYLGSLAKPGGWKQTESNQPFHFVSVRVIDQKGKEENRFSLGSEVVLEIRAEAHEQLASSHVAVLVRFEGSPLFLSFDTDDFPDCLLNRPAGTVTYHLKINTGHLKPGRYDVRLNTGVQRRPAFEVLDNVVWFELYDQDGDFDRSWARDRGGVMKCPGKWMLA
jgi:lipopolysaccharide transport system ATP-binding protein